MDASIGAMTLYQDTIYDNQLLNNQLVTLQAQAPTGQKFANVSDDPVDAMHVIADNDQNQLDTTDLSNIQSATAALNTSTSALTQVDNVFSQAQSIAVQASNSTNDASAYGAMAQQVGGLISDLLTAANTQNNGTTSSAARQSTRSPTSSPARTAMEIRRRSPIRGRANQVQPSSIRAKAYRSITPAAASSEPTARPPTPSRR